MLMASIYEQSMSLQAHLDSKESRIDKNTIATLGLQIINNKWDSSLIRAARSSSAYFIADGLTTESFVNPLQKFDEVVLKGHVPRITCIDLLGRFIIVLPFFDAEVLGPTQEIEAQLVEYELDGYDTALPLNTTLQRPLYTPLENLEFITLAA